MAAGRPRNKDNDYIKICGVNKKTKQSLENIAVNLSTSISALLKPKVIELIESYPEETRRKPLDY